MEKITLVLPEGITKKIVLESFANANDYEKNKLSFRTPIKCYEDVLPADVTVVRTEVEELFTEAEAPIEKKTVCYYHRNSDITKEAYGLIIIGKENYKMFKDTLITIANKKAEHARLVELQNIGEAMSKIDAKTGRAE